MKVSINFIIDKEGDRPDGKLRMRVRWGKDQRVAVNLGYRVEFEKWSADSQRCKANTAHGKKKVHASEINAEIQRYENAAETAALQFHDEPSPDEYRSVLRLCLGREAQSEGMAFKKVWPQYVMAKSADASWTETTEKDLMTFAQKIKREHPNVTIEEMATEEWASREVEARISSGRKNSSTSCWLVRLKAFISWCASRGLVDDSAIKDYNPKFKQTDKGLVWFSWEQLMTLFNADFHYKPREFTRDVVCFSCFTGLRISDVAMLRWDNISDSAITIYTKKTSARITIELNKYSRAILQRRRESVNKIWPEYVFGLPDANRLSHRVNEEIKSVCKVLGFDQPVSQCYYVGGERKTRIEPFYNLVTSHCGRRTFICNALEMGISPEVVMKWTGHASYDTMRPYIAVSDRSKEEAMKKFDR